MKRDSTAKTVRNGVNTVRNKLNIFLSPLRILGRQTLALIIHLLRRHPQFMALVGLAAGTLSFVLVQRQADESRYIAIFMLLTWVWLVLDRPIRHLLVARMGFKLSPYALKYATQLVHQESLFFALPFFVITTSWGDPQMMFTLLLISAGIISIVDPIYYRHIAGNRWIYPLFHGFSLFALLLTALPILVSMTTHASYLWALIIAGLVSIPTITRAISAVDWRGHLARVSLLGFLGVAGWLMQPWVPPATLWVTDSAITHVVNPDRSPEQRLYHVAQSDLDSAGLMAFTAVRAPLGLNERIYHEWYHNGELIDRIALEINGGREGGYRSWSRKEMFPSNPVGRWDVRIMTQGRQMIGQRTFVVTTGIASKPDSKALTNPGT